MEGKYAYVLTSMNIEESSYIYFSPEQNSKEDSNKLYCFPSRRPDIMLTPAGAMFVVVVLFVLSSCSAAADSSNEREFYIVLEGLGPTGGSSINSPDTVWARSLVWQDYLGVSSQWDTTLEAIKEVRNKLNWSVYTTVVGSKARQKRRQKHQTPKRPIPNISHTVETLISVFIFWA